MTPPGFDNAALRRLFHLWFVKRNLGGMLLAEFCLLFALPLLFALVAVALTLLRLPEWVTIILFMAFAFFSLVRAVRFLRAVYYRGKEADDASL